jgi:hypothetical protein
MISPVLLSGQNYLKAAGLVICSGGLIWTLCPNGIPTGRCKNNGTPRFVTIIIDSAGVFLHPSHARPHEQTPPAHIKGRGVR